MDKKLDLGDFVLLGRTMDEYFNMFDLSDELLKKSKTLDVGSGVSSFCAEANARGFEVTASDKIYVFRHQEIEAKCSRDLDLETGFATANGLYFSAGSGITI